MKTRHNNSNHDKLEERSTEEVVSASNALPEKKMDAATTDTVNPNVEMGYLYLEKCSIEILHGTELESQLFVQNDKWISVEIPVDNHCPIARMTSSDEQDSSSESCCSRCNLVISTSAMHWPQQGIGNEAIVDDSKQSPSSDVRVRPPPSHPFTVYQGGPRFDGTVQDLGSHRVGDSSKMKMKSKQNATSSTQSPPSLPPPQSSSPSSSIMRPFSAASCTCPQARGCRTTRQGKRSDAALLLGLALSCQDSGQIKIQSLQIRRIPRVIETSTNAATTKATNANLLEPNGGHFLQPQQQQQQSQESHHQPKQPEQQPLDLQQGMPAESHPAKDSHSYTTCDVSLVITIAFPHLWSTSSDDVVGTRSSSHRIKQGQRRRRITSHSSNKLLPASTQLLLSIVRSDWEVLDGILHSTPLPPLSDSRSKAKRRSSSALRMFPSQLSLEEVYKRISAAGSSLPSPSRNASFLPPQHQNKHHHHHHPHQLVPNSCYLLQVPKELILVGIVPYLRAKSLDALRCSCTVLHHMMRSVVPGLKLKLYSHQIKSLGWMRRRESRQLEEKDFWEVTVPASTDGDDHSLDKSSSSNQLRFPGRPKVRLPQDDGDAHRAVTGGVSVYLRPRKDYVSDTTDKSSTAGSVPFVRIAQDTGVEMMSESNILSRRMARGAILCDSPGLGKTITVLSLILQTLGLSTARASISQPKASSKRNRRSNGKNGDSEATHGNDNHPIRVDDDDQDTVSQERIFVEYWKEQVVPDFRRPALLRLVSYLIQSHKSSNYFYNPINPSVDGCEDYYDVIKAPICLLEIRATIEKDGYGDDFSLFVSDVERCLRNATVYNPPENAVHQAALRLSTNFLTLVEEFKAKQIRAAQKSFARSSAKPNSAVAALIEEEHRKRVLDSLIPSSGTLIVVPGVLMEHWRDQLRLHVNLAYLTTRIPIIFEYHGTASCGLRMEEIVIQCKVKKTHFPFAFLDLTNTKQLPSPKFLGMFSIVLTTNQRFTNEWKNGSFEDELKRKSSNYDEDEFRDSLQNSEKSCPLLKINWLRMIVDEGHSMGRGKGNSAILFASWITAERRWAMTGTPTRQTVTQNGLSNILGLMNYLQHDFFSHRRDGQATWQNLILRGWNAGYIASFCRLKSLLKLFMVRHTKNDIEELPPPQYFTTVLNMSSEEVTTYNTLVCAVQSNLLLTSMEGKTSGAQDSLLQRSQARNAKEALSNVRLVCAGGTRVVPTLSDKNWDEFLSLLRDSNAPKDKYREVQNYLHRAVTEQLSSCACCGMMLSTLLVFPCGDLVCTECVDNKSTSCVVCDQEFDVDDFQRLQPGLFYNWLHNIEEEHKKKKDAPQSSFRPAVDHEHVRLSEGGVGNFAPRNPDTPRRRTRKPGDGHTCEYDRWAISGECTLCWKEHDGCNLMNSLARCDACYRMAEACPQSESKSYYIIERLVKLYEKQQWKLERNQLANPWRLGAEMPIIEQQRPVKVIVFSQFRKVLNMVGDRLLRRFGTACVAEYWGKFRKQELHKFVHDNECCCMLLGKDGSEGLDLSFVTQVIFLEQVWDKSLEHQVVARAWRMGAKGAVEVETLIAENSVEQTMRRLERANAAEDLLEEDELDIGMAEEDNNGTVQGEELSVTDDKSDEYRRAKLHYLLKGLQLIKNPYTLSFGGDTKRKPSSFADMSSSATTAPACPIQPTHMVSPMKRRKVGQVRFDMMDPSLA